MPKLTNFRCLTYAFTEYCLNTLSAKIIQSSEVFKALKIKVHRRHDAGKLLKSQSTVQFIVTRVVQFLFTLL